MSDRWTVLLAAAALAALAAATTARAGEAHIYISPQAGFPSLSGDGSTRDGAVTGPQDFGVDQTLDAANRDVHLGFDFLARLGRHRIVAGYSHGTHDGENKLPDDLQFDNLLFNAGSNLKSEIKLTRRRAFYGYSFINSGMLDVGVLVGGDGYDVSTQMSQSGVGSKKAKIDSPAPALGLNLGLRPPVLPLRFYAEMVYSSLKISGVDTKLTDGYAVLDWYLIPVVKLFGVQAGYRYYDLDAVKDKSGKRREFNYKIQGPFVGVVFRF
jgi:hypothetical protein